MLIEPFAGGCAVTSEALHSCKWERIVANDISPFPLAFADVLRNSVVIPDRWLGYDEYQERWPSLSPFDKLAWSFGSKGDAYFCSKDKEPLQYAAFMLCRHGDDSFFPPAVRELLGRASLPAFTQYDDHWRRASTRALSALYGRQGVFSVLERYACAQNLHQALAPLAAPLITSQRDYRDIRVPPGSVVYCDPPYAGTSGYGVKFCHEDFYSWLHAIARHGARVYVSEYTAPPGFSEIWSSTVPCTLPGTCNSNKATERLFTIDA